MREFLKGLELDKETIDTIMAEHGKRVTEDKELITQLESEVKSYKDKIVELEEVSKDSAKIQEELTTLKTQLEEETAKKEQEERDRALTERIEEVYGDKKFVNDFTKNAITNEMKKLIENEDNKTRSYTELFEELVKDKEGIFSNPNEPQKIDGINENLDLNKKKDIPLIF